MSSANQVPTTWKLEGDDARSTLATTGRMRLIQDAFVRLRAADGFSHARAMAFATVLVIVQALIALVGLAAALNAGGISDLIVKTMRSIAPGPAGSVLTQAVTQAHQAGSSHRYLALVLGTVGAVITACTLMGQMERGLNRLYGIERDRPTVRKYARAFVLAVSAGAAVAVAFTAMTFGRQIAASLGSDLAIRVWEALRWPIALVLLTLAIALVFRWSPYRRQPTWSWLAFGSAISVILWVAVTASLGLFFSYSSTFGRTYGPLAGIVALILWSLLSSIAVLFGGAIAAQLEAVRAGVPAPRRDAPDVRVVPTAQRLPVPAGERG
jgi:YihY family inner membrane protein